MGNTKKLYLDGKLVGEYEGADDPETDRDLAVAMLREKGLYRETTVEQAIFRQAVSFSTTSSYLYQRDLTTVPRNGLSVAPFVVNAAFAIELYMKAVAHLYGEPVVRGHDLLDLFDALPHEAYAAFQQNFSKCNFQCGIAEIAAFRYAIEQLRNAFVQWRYLHETSVAREIHIQPMIFVMEVLHETCRAHEKLRKSM